ncbi:MAG: hypothetical protein GY816_07195, partial [Cytophagales bacterium]|nr:hypothetical protein [Cytophagales bacterium]
MSEESIESLFVQVTNTVEPTTVGVIYRSPNSSRDKFFDEIERIIAKLPSKNVYILGDFNLNFFSGSTLDVSRFEEEIISNGYYPLISLATNHVPGCEQSCIDNIFTNRDPGSVIASGKVLGKISTHSAIFQVSEVFISDDEKNEPKTKIEYDYCLANVAKFQDLLRNALADEAEAEVQSMQGFMTLFQDCINKSCKLEKPKFTKRNTINNPWITPAVLESIHRNDDLYKSWVKTCTRKNPSGNVAMRQSQREYQIKLRWVIKTAKSKYYLSKFKKCINNKKKTWQLINELRGKSAKSTKASFIISNERIQCRRLIAEKFNEYFVNIPGNLNEAAYKDKALNQFPSFQSFLSPACQKAISLHECSAGEIEGIIKDLDSGKSSDIPIMLVKATRPIISSVLSKLYNDCMSTGEFPDILKRSRVTPIFKKGNRELLENYRPVSTLP